MSLNDYPGFQIKSSRELQSVEEDSMNSNADSNYSFYPIDDSEITDIDSSCSQSDIKDTQVEDGRRCEDVSGNDGSSNRIKILGTKSLADLLSGKQLSKKSEIKAGKVEAVKDHGAEKTQLIISHGCNATSLKRDLDVLELEKKMFKNISRSQPASDFFGQSKQTYKSSNLFPVNSKDTKEMSMYMQGSLVPLSYKKDAQINEPKLSDSMTPDIYNKLLESKICGETKRKTSPKDIFKSLKPIRRDSQHLITLKLSPKLLSNVKLNSSFKTKGNYDLLSSSTEVIDLTDFFDQKGLRTKEKEKDIGKSLHKTISQNTKRLDPPILKKNEFHIVDTSRLLHRNTALLCLPLKVLPVLNDTQITDKSTFLFEKEFPNFPKLIIEPSTQSINNLVSKALPSLTKNSALEFITEEFIFNTSNNNNSELWINLFQPRKLNDVLISPKFREKIRDWIRNCFKKLESKSFASSRNVQLKKQKQKIDSMDFMVDDNSPIIFEEEQEETYVPLLIIQGSIGSCKSSAVYASVNEIDGYVFEVNSGQPRGKKDIFHNLKEFSTTQLVHKRSESRQFQKGLVLFEDVDIQFDQDKNFWAVVQEILNITRRPIVLTCQSVDNIPQNLLDVSKKSNSLIKLDDEPPNIDLLQNYLWLCCISQGYNLESLVIREILDESYNGTSYDVRRSLMNCQLLCQSDMEKNDSQVKNLSFHSAYSVDTSGGPYGTLEVCADRLECLSEADIISTNTNSSLTHDSYFSELLGTYQISQASMLREPTLEHELNVGDYILDVLNIGDKEPANKLSFNQTREVCERFIGSRAKKLPKYMLDLNFYGRVTRSSRSENQIINRSINSSTGIPESSLINNLSQITFIIDLLPFFRNWFSFQILLNQMEQESQSKSGISIKKFLNYRDFQILPGNLIDTINYYLI
ncbi:uncharacterized protein PRCAT00001106001 [Priceomyces carsonii]|uniref:uncharacterized protein n=1 Tax=Priceomyces carsonii TaxID=28549 RepID=UPI002ED7754F|nr:unnamed protein product [Priceomyces carsonii]